MTASIQFYLGIMVGALGILSINQKIVRIMIKPFFKMLEIPIKVVLVSIIFLVAFWG